MPGHVRRDLKRSSPPSWNATHQAHCVNHEKNEWKVSCPAAGQPSVRVYPPTWSADWVRKPAPSRGGAEASGGELAELERALLGMLAIGLA